MPVSSKTNLLPTGGFKRWLCASIQLAKLKGRRRASIVIAACLPVPSPWGCEHFGPQILVDDLVEEPLRFADFRIHMSAKPGLGVTLDHDKVRRYARA